MSESSSNTDVFNLNDILETLLEIQQNSGVLTSVEVDKNKGTRAVVKPALAHLISESDSYKLSNLKWENAAQVKTHFKKLTNFLTSTEKQIGRSSLTDLLEHVMDKVFHDTPFHGLAVGHAKEKVHWKLILKEFREILNIPALDYSLEVYSHMENYTPPADSLLRLAITQLLSWIKQANLQIDEIIAEMAADTIPDETDVSMRSANASTSLTTDVTRSQLHATLLPSPIVMASRVTSWVPIAIKPVLPQSLTENNVRYTMDQFEADLISALKKIPPTTRVAVQRKEHNKREAHRPQEPAVLAGSSHPPAAQDGERVSKSHNHPNAGRLGMLLSRDHEPHPVAVSVLGRCVVTVNDDGSEQEDKKRVRIDTGTDEDIFDVTLLPFAERLGPSDKSYVSPLSPKPRKAERGRVTFAAIDTEGNEIRFTRTGVLDPFGSSAFRPDGINISDGLGTVTISGHVLPTFAQNKNAYVSVWPVASETPTKVKSIYDFARNCGFSPGHPAPPLHVIAKI